MCSRGNGRESHGPAGTGEKEEEGKRKEERRKEGKKERKKKEEGEEDGVNLYCGWSFAYRGPFQLVSLIPLVSMVTLLWVL